jgi:hypothetical protein
MTNFVEVPVYRGFTEIRFLYELLGETGAVICGGYARYMCSPHQSPVSASDVDVYCPTEEIFKKTKFLLESYDLKKKHENSVSLTYHQPLYKDNENFFRHLPIQLIKPIKEGKIVTIGSPETIIDNFDFTVIRIALISEEMALADSDFTGDELSRKLHIKNIHCPISSTLRCCKYSRKGYWLSPFQAMKLFLDWSDRPESYRARLLDFFKKSEESGQFTQKEIDELEALMRVD